jgi:hypothetical protein
MEPATGEPTGLSERHVRSAESMKCGELVPKPRLVMTHRVSRPSVSGGRQSCWRIAKPGPARAIAC